MAPSDFLVSTFVALMFILWPFAGKHSGANGAWLVAFVMLTTGVVAAVIGGVRGEPMSGFSHRALLLLVAAGILNGLGCYFYGVWAANPRISTATFVVSVNIVMCIAAPVLEAILLKHPPSPRHIAGFSCAACAVYLLR